jgi:catechol 2,3-dioxygenase-like lactoylglutathione lyase family enzyme
MMRFHHMGVFVSDIDAALRLWIDVLGFALVHRATIPDGRKNQPGTRMPAETLDDIFGVKDARSEMALLTSPDGAMIELQCPQVPSIEKTPPEKLRYGHTGIHELGFQVENIEDWFEKIRAAGYRTQTEYVWPWAVKGKSFLFYDQDGNLIQFCEQPGTPSWRP